MSQKLWARFCAYLCVIALLCGLIFLLSRPEESNPVVYEPTQAPATTQSKPDDEAVPETEPLSFETIEQAEEYVREYASEKGYDINDYPEKLIELMVKDETSIPFVLDYPMEITKEHNSVISDSELDNGVPLFLQWDARWGYHSFKNGVVALDGCGATCLSMAAVYLIGDTGLSPDVIADYAAENGYFVDGSGTSWDLFTKGINHYGLKSKNVSNRNDAIKNALSKGNPIIASVGAGDFTKKGHYIVIVGYDDDGFIVNDPYSLVNSQKRWSYERLAPQIKTMWQIYK